MPGKRRSRNSAPRPRRVEEDAVVAGRAQVRGDRGRDDVARREVGERVGAGHDPPSRPVDEHGALAADRLRHQHLLPGGVRALPEHGRVELHHLDVGHLGAGPQREGEAVAGGAGGVAGRGVDVPVATRGQHDRAGTQVAAVDEGPVVGDAGDPQADDRAVGRAQRLEGDGVLEHLDAAGAQGAGEGAGHLGAAGVTAGVHDPVAAVTALAGERRAAVGGEVESGPEPLELGDGVGRLLDEGADGVLVAEPGAGDEGVLHVQVGVVVGAEDGGQPALRPVRAAVAEGGLRDHRDPASGVGQRQGGHQPGRAGADDGDVGVAAPRRAGQGQGGDDDRSAFRARRRGSLTRRPGTACRGRPSPRRRRGPVRRSPGRRSPRRGPRAARAAASRASTSSCTGRRRAD